jgi:lipopolysaccharide export system permease protein
MKELLQEADKVKKNTRRKRKLYIEFHRRLVLPFGCLMLSLIGLPLGLQARPGKRAIGIQAGLAIFVLYYIMFTFGKTMVEEDVLPVVFAMWAPNFIFFSLAVYWIVQIANERPLIPKWITGLYTKFIYVISTFIVKPLKKHIRVLRGLEEDLESSIDEMDIVQTAMTIRGNAKSRVFHLPACEYYRCKNCTLEFKNIEVALDAGFDPCRFCKHLIDE